MLQDFSEIYTNCKSHLNRAELGRLHQIDAPVEMHKKNLLSAAQKLPFN